MEEDDSDITVAIQGSNEVILKVRRLEDVDAARLVQAAEHAAGCKGFLFCPEGRVIFSGAPLMKGEYHYRPYIHVQGGQLVVCLELVALQGRSNLSASRYS